MSCVNLTSIECGVLLTSQQDVKLFFIFFYFIIFLFFWYYFTNKRMKKIKYTYFIYPIMVTKWVGLIYVFLSPVHFLLYQGDLNYDLILGWFSLFYIPTMVVTLSMPFLWMFDKIFRLLGYEGAFDFVNKYRGKTL